MSETSRKKFAQLGFRVSKNFKEWFKNQADENAMGSQHRYLMSLALKEGYQPVDEDF